MKNLLKNLGSGGQGTSVQPVVNLAAFGKHPGWDDHIPGVGLETEGLAQFKQLFYVTGIGGQIDLGAWEKLAAEQRVEGFDHTFLWHRAGHLFMGRMWSSKDRKGRAKYPMILCVESEGVPPGMLLSTAGKELEQLRGRCVSAETSVEIEAACQDARGRLRAELNAPGMTAEPGPLPLEIRRSFLDNPVFGEKRLGLLRVLHELEDVRDFSTKTRGLTVGAPVLGRSRHLRVPAPGGRTEESLRLWLEFFERAIPANMPVMLLSRAGADWVDVVVGEPSGQEFFCLQASPQALPFSTQIPYELKPEAAARLESVATAFLGVPTAVEPRAPSAPMPVASPVPQASPAGPAPRKFPWLLVVVIAVVVIAGILFASRPRQTIAPAGGDSKGDASAPGKTSTPVADSGAAPAPPVSPAAVGRQKFDQALKQAADALQAGQYQSAVGAAEAALAIQPGNPNATGIRQQAQAKLDEQAQLQQAEAAYQAILRQGQAYLTANDYSNALAQAQLALNQKAGDAVALDLQQRAQAGLAERAAAEKGAAEYAAAMQQAQAYLTQNDYSNALAQAQLALGKKPGDAPAQTLARQAQAGLDQRMRAQQEEADYQAALQRSRDAFAAKDFEAALAAAQAALAGKPGDSTAQDLLDRAQKMRIIQQKELREQEQFNQLLAAGQAALAQYANEAAISNADAALALQPESRAARDLKEKGQNGVQYDADVEAGQAALRRNDLETARQQAAAALSLNPTGPAALKLQADASMSGDVDKVKDLAGKNKYAEALALCRQHANDPAFASLATSIEMKFLQAIDDQLEVFQVWFGLIDPAQAKSALAREPRQAATARTLAEGELPMDDKDTYRKDLGQLESELRDIRQLQASRAKVIAQIKKAIDDHQ